MLEVNGERIQIDCLGVVDLDEAVTILKLLPAAIKQVRQNRIERLKEERDVLTEKINDMEKEL